MELSDIQENYYVPSKKCLLLSHATLAPAIAFNGWGGGCSGTGACTVTLNSAMSVTASFNKGGRNET
jgi:hypothetical protein